MKSRYKRKAWLLDEDVLIEGYTDKRGFHPNDNSCGFSVQKFRKRDIGKTVFFRNPKTTLIGKGEILLLGSPHTAHTTPFPDTILLDAEKGYVSTDNSIYY